MFLDMENMSSHSAWSFLNGSEGNLTNATSDTTPQPFDYYNVDHRAKKFLVEPHNVVTLLLGFLGVIANTITLMAIGRMKGSLTPHFKCITSLVVSDLMIALSMVLHLVNFVVNPRTPLGKDGGTAAMRMKSHCAFMVIKALNSTFLNVTLLNLVIMALDIYIAIFRPFKYHNLLSNKRTNIMIITVWVIAFSCGFTDFISPLFELDNYNTYKYYYNYCEFIYITKYQEEFTVFAIAFIALVAMSYMYIHIYIKVKQLQKCGPPGQELRKNKKAVVTTFLILGTFIVCWSPMCIFSIVMIVRVIYYPDSLQSQDYQKMLFDIDKYLYHLVIINSLLDPIIYAVRIREVRYGYVNLILCVCPGWGKGRQIIKRMNIRRSNSVVGTSFLERQQSQMSNESNDLLTSGRSVVPNSKRRRSSSLKLSIAAFVKLTKVHERQLQNESPEENGEIQEETSLINCKGGTISPENTNAEQIENSLPITNENENEE